MSKSIHVRQTYSKPKVGRFLRHGVQWITLRNGETNTRLLCCGDSRLSFCHINTRISKPVEDISWKHFCHKNRVANTVLVTKIASRRCLLQAWKCAKIVFGQGFVPDPTGGAYSAPPDPIAGGEGAGCPLPKNPSPPWPFGPRAFAVSSTKHPRI